MRNAFEIPSNEIHMIFIYANRLADLFNHYDYWLRMNADNQLHGKIAIRVVFMFVLFDVYFFSLLILLISTSIRPGIFSACALPVTLISILWRTKIELSAHLVKLMLHI